MVNLALTKDAVLSERDVVMEERRLRYEDDPQGLVYEKAIAMAFMNHPYQWPVIGWMSDLKALDPEDLIKHYRTYYAPNNAVIIIVGDVKKEEILQKVIDAFGGIPAGPPIKTVKTEEEKQKGERRIFIKKEAELPFIVSVYKVPDIKHEDGFALDVLGSILSEGKSSRLYQSLVYKQQVALSAWASYEGLYKDPFLFLTGATVASGKSVEEVEKAINDELDNIKKHLSVLREFRKPAASLVSIFFQSICVDGAFSAKSKPRTG